MNSLLSDSGVVAPFTLRRNSEMINCPAVATLGLSSLIWPAADTRRPPATDTHSRHTPSAERHQRVIPSLPFAASQEPGGSGGDSTTLAPRAPSAALGPVHVCRVAVEHFGGLH